MRTFATWLLLAAVAGAPAAAPAERKIVGSCTYPRACADYDGEREDAKHKCDAFRAAWKARPCPSARRVATCVNDWGRGSSFTHFYAPTTRAEAKKMCEDGLGRLR